MVWPGYRQGLWTLLCDEAQRLQIDCEGSITGYDADSAAVKVAQDNCERSGNSGQVSIIRLSLADQPVHDGHGLVVCNPPYGKRLSLDSDSKACYRDIGSHLNRVYPGWRKAMLCPDPALVKASGLSLKQVAKLDNGGLSVGLYATDSRV